MVNNTLMTPPRPRLCRSLRPTYYPLAQIKAGTLVLLHHSLVHYSEANTSEKSRHAYSIHVVEGKEGCRYPGDNWLQRPADAPFQRLS